MAVRKRRLPEPTIVRCDGKYHVLLSDKDGEEHWLEIAKGRRKLKIRDLGDSLLSTIYTPQTNISLYPPWHLKDVTGNGNGGALIVVEGPYVGNREYALKMTGGSLKVSPRKCNYLR